MIQKSNKQNIWYFDLIFTRICIQLPCVFTWFFLVKWYCIAIWRLVKPMKHRVMTIACCCFCWYLSQIYLLCLHHPLSNIYLLTQITSKIHTSNFSSTIWLFCNGSLTGIPRTLRYINTWWLETFCFIKCKLHMSKKNLILLFKTRRKILQIHW